MAVIPRREYVKHSRPVLVSKRWKVLRQVILERDGWQCRCCGTRRGRLEVDHVEPVRNAPNKAFEPGNLQTLCSRCHASKTRKEMGFPPVRNNPEQRAWASAVAELAAETSTQTKE